jgi:uncharacterized membrane protein
MAAAAPAADFALPQPIAEDAEFDATNNVVLVASDSKERFLVSRQGLMRFSKLARGLLEQAGDDEPLPLDNPHCTADTVKAFVVWVNKHADKDVALTKISYPLASGELSAIFTDWDLQFIQTALVPGGDMKQNKALYFLAGLSVYLNVVILQEMCCAYFAWHIRKATDDSKAEGAPTATAVVRSWFGMDGDFTEDELKGIVEKYKWCRDVDYNQIEKDSEDAHEFATKFSAPA